MTILRSNPIHTVSIPPRALDLRQVVVSRQTSLLRFQGESPFDNPDLANITPVLNPNAGVLKAQTAIVAALKLPPEAKHWTSQMGDFLKRNFWPFGSTGPTDRLTGNIQPSDVQVVYPSRFKSKDDHGYPLQGLAISVPSTVDEVAVVETLQKKLGFFLPAKEMPKGCYRYFDTPVEIWVKTDRPG
jgi:hypothetical protein